jgi:hypothetical protein
VAGWVRVHLMVRGDLRGNGDVRGAGVLAGSNGEERSGSGMQVTTPMQLPGDWSALRHAGHAVGPCPEGDRRRGRPGRPRGRGPAPQGHRPGRTHRRRERGTAEGGRIAAAGPGDRASADEAAIMQVPGDAWKPGIGEDGARQDDKDVAELTRPMSRAGNWPAGLRWIVCRVRPSRRQMPNLTAYEKKTG